MEKKRLKIVVDTIAAFNKFIEIMNQQTDDYYIENESGTIRVSAKSMLGAYYAYVEGIGHTFFLSNASNDGIFPSLTNFHPF